MRLLGAEIRNCPHFRGSPMRDAWNDQPVILSKLVERNCGEERATHYTPCWTHRGCRPGSVRGSDC